MSSPQVDGEEASLGEEEKAVQGRHGRVAGREQAQLLLAKRTAMDNAFMRVVSAHALVVAAFVVLPSSWYVVGSLASDEFIRQPSGQLWRAFVGIQILLWIAVLSANWPLVQLRSLKYWLCLSIIILSLLPMATQGRVPPVGLFPDLKTMGP